MTEEMDVSTDELGLKTAEWHELDIDVLKAALLYSKNQPDGWWQEYKKITHHANDLEVKPTSYVSGKIDDRWGSEFSETGWREVEHLEQ